MNKVTVLTVIYIIIMTIFGIFHCNTITQFMYIIMLLIYVSNQLLYIVSVVVYISHDPESDTITKHFFYPVKNYNNNY